MKEARLANAPLLIGTSCSGPEAAARVLPAPPVSICKRHDAALWLNEMRLAEKAVSILGCQISAGCDGSAFVWKESALK